MALSVHYDVVPVLGPDQVKSFVPVATIEQYFQVAAASALAYHMSKRYVHSLNTLRTRLTEVKLRR